MTDDLNVKREDMKIEGGRNLYSYTFTDDAGDVIPPEPVPHSDQPKEGPAAPGSKGNLNPKEGENRKG